ncbi:MAG: hypothetical protein AB7O98_18830 [Hyphomonadaceae bacterium]
MNAFGKSSVVFVTLSGLFWGGWVVGSQTPEGQEALARAYQTYTEQQAAANEHLFDTTALRAIVCGDESGVDRTDPKPCLAVAAAGRLFIVDAGAGASSSLTRRGIPLERLEAVLLTDADLPQTADLSALFAESTRGGQDGLLPVYGPSATQRLVDGLNQAGGFDGATRGLQAWGPSPEEGRSVIVFEADGLVVSAFATEDSFNGSRVAYRFDYRGRSIVVGGDGQAAGVDAARDADVILQGAQSEALARVGDERATAADIAADAQAGNAGMLMLTGAENQMAAQVQVAEARAAGFDNVRPGRAGMLVELPLENSEINVRPL